ncbi:hypothetical protein [Pseudaestuariivita sp.]|uniref:hypothetical protein n=1 Tax=Pseudaestuariivita sp. TaxID=2211669 RepID=UPI004059E6CF
MIFAMGRLLLILFVVLTIVYVCLSLYSRQTRRRKLERAWEEDGMTGDKEQWVRQGLEEYDGSVRRKLILGVYVVPVILIAVIFYMTNFA